MSAITYANKFTTGNTNAGGVAGATVTCVTTSTCKLIVIGFTISGTSNMSPSPKIGLLNFTKIGSTVATSEGNVELWYMNTNTASITGVISYNNSFRLYHTADVSTYTSSDSINFDNTGSTFSISGRTASINLGLSTNTGSVCITQYNSGYSSTSNVSNNGTVLYKLDRGNLISGSSYMVDTSATTCNLYWSTPVNDDYAMIQAGFISGEAASTSDITSWNTVAFNSMTSTNTVNITSLGSINSIGTGN
jgi:hypothetical protein